MPEAKDLPTADQRPLGAVFAALADPHRRTIIKEFPSEPPGARRKGSRFELKVSKLTMTHRFRVLRESGLVVQYEFGNRAELELRRADLDARFPGLLDLVANGDG